MKFYFVCDIQTLKITTLCIKNFLNYFINFDEIKFSISREVFAFVSFSESLKYLYIGIDIKDEN